MTKEQKAKAELFKTRIAENDVWLERAIHAVWKYQTQSEQLDEATKLNNGVGFNGTDGSFLTSLGNWIDRRTFSGSRKDLFGKVLSAKQKAFARKKMAKYAAQLVRISESAQ
jgi:hypothetical protein